MIYNVHKCGSYNIHTIKTDKFKNIRMEIIFRNNIDPNTIASRTLLFDLLVESSNKYPTKRDLVLKQELLYNASLYSVSNRIGNQIITSIVMDFLNPKYTKDNYLAEAIRLPFELIFNPLVNNNEFNSQTLENIKTRTIADIKSLYEQPSKLAIKNALKNFDENSISSIDINGTIDSITTISSTSIYKTYLDILKHDYVDIYVIGDFDENKIVDEIVKNAQFNTIKKHELSLEVKNKTRSKNQLVKEKSSFLQSHIVYIYNINNLNDYERKYVFNLYNNILGGSALESKLYQKLRGENSLCYGISSIYQKYDNLLIIYTSVDPNNVNKAQKLIEQTINEMINNITEDDLNIAKDAIISSINMSLDMPGRIIDQYLFHNISDLDLIDERISQYKTVSLKDIKIVAKKIKSNTIYVLEGDTHEKN